MISLHLLSGMHTFPRSTTSSRFPSRNGAMKEGGRHPPGSSRGCRALEANMLRLANDSKAMRQSACWEHPGFTARQAILHTAWQGWPLHHLAHVISQKSCRLLIRWKHRPWLFNAAFAVYMYSRSPKVGNPIASIPKSNV